MASSSGERALTCITCRLVFASPEEMREHYKGDLHRFNLKRKVANLPPVPETIYNQKVAAVAKQKTTVPQKGRQHLKDGKKNADQTGEKIEKKEAVPLSEFDKKVLLDEHHVVEEMAPSPTDVSVDVKTKGSPVESQKTEEERIDEKIAQATRLSLKDSLFDNHRATSFEHNLRYMTKQFGFFIPEIEYISDVKGLIRYLGEKVAIGNTCLYCEKAFYSLEAVQAHMRDTSHCIMLWEDNEDEYAEYYDYSKDERRNEEGEEEVTYVSERNELVLASGKTLGHRALKVYYDQRSHTRSHQQLITSLMQEHRRLQAIEHAKGTHLSRKALERQRKFALDAGMKANNQKHYRAQIPI